MRYENGIIQEILKDIPLALKNWIDSINLDRFMSENKSIIRGIESRLQKDHLLLNREIFDFKDKIQFDSEQLETQVKRLEFNLENVFTELKKMLNSLQSDFRIAKIDFEKLFKSYSYSDDFDDFDGILSLENQQNSTLKSSIKIQAARNHSSNLAYSHGK